MFSICLCTYNDLEYIKLLYKSMKQNCKFDNEMCIHVNGSNDGTHEWLSSLCDKNVFISTSKTNEGVTAVNKAVKLANREFIVDINADMYIMPGWDLNLYSRIKQLQSSGVEKFVLSSCLLQPTSNHAHDRGSLLAEFGKDSSQFDEEGLLEAYKKSNPKTLRSDLNHWFHPIAMKKSFWDEIGGMDERYFPGDGSDDDMIAKAYKNGCRYFIGVNDAHVYHFVSKTNYKKEVNELRKTNGAQDFFDKWGFTIEHMTQKFGRPGPFKKLEDGLI